MYAIASGFVVICLACVREAHDEFYKHDEYLLKETKLCVSNCSIRELIVREAHSGSLIIHFGVKKILDMLH